MATHYSLYVSGCRPKYEPRSCSSSIMHGTHGTFAFTLSKLYLAYRVEDEQRRQRFSVIHGTFARKEAALQQQMTELQQQLPQQQALADEAVAQAEQHDSAAKEALEAHAEC